MLVFHFNCIMQMLGRHGPQAKWMGEGTNVDISEGQVLAERILLQLVNEKLDVGAGEKVENF